ncbi:hypothetical protein IT407_02165 [Candidatus Uhrbacteria bacterium]|nr:hypothetical protein [Candidatus Uhrbacteria bacterium]
MAKLDPIQRLKDRYGKAIRYRIVQRGSYRTRPWIIEVLLDSIVVGQGQHADERPAKKLAVKNAVEFLDKNGSARQIEEEKFDIALPHQEIFRQRFGKHAGEVIGHIKERLLVEMTGDPWAKTKPVWLKNIRRGTAEEDRLKIDLVAETDRGEIPIQVKSSIQGASKHTLESDIPVFIYSTFWGRHTAYKRFLAWLEKIYKLKGT